MTMPSFEEMMQRQREAHDRMHMSQEAYRAAFDTWLEDLSGETLDMVNVILTTIIQGGDDPALSLGFAQWLKGRLYSVNQREDQKRALEAPPASVNVDESKPSQSPELQAQLDKFEVNLVTDSGVREGGRQVQPGNVTCNNCGYVYSSLAERVNTGPAGKAGCIGCQHKSATGA